MVLSSVERSQSYATTSCYFRYSGPFSLWLLDLNQANLTLSTVPLDYSPISQESESTPCQDYILHRFRNHSLRVSSDSLISESSVGTYCWTSKVSSVYNRFEVLSVDIVNGEVSLMFTVLDRSRTFALTPFALRWKCQIPTACSPMSPRNRIVEDTTIRQVNKSAILLEAGSPLRKIRKGSFVPLRVFASFVSSSYTSDSFG